jgi:hypothetical protein
VKRFISEKVHKWKVHLKLGRVGRELEVRGGRVERRGGDDEPREVVTRMLTATPRQHGGWWRQRPPSHVHGGRHCNVSNTSARHDYGWHVMATADTSWLRLTRHGYTWHVMTTADTSWLRLTHNDYGWHVMATADTPWLRLTRHGYGWHVMTTADTSCYGWHVMATADTLWLRLTRHSYGLHIMSTTDMSWLLLTRHGYGWDHGCGWGKNFLNWNTS